MYTYIPVSHHFRISTWPSGGEYVSTYRSDRFKFQIKPVLDYVKEQLEKVPSSDVFKTAFTLINAYSSYFKNSIGYYAEPAFSVRSSPITFTFTRSLLEQSHYPKPIFWQTHYTAVWGARHDKPLDNISISLPLSLISSSGIHRALNAEMLAFYDILGAYSKAVIMQRKPMETDINLIADRVLYWNIPKATQELNVKDWPYCPDFWKRIPELLTVEWTPKFLEYYCVYIAPRLPDFLTDQHIVFEDRAKEHIKQYLLRYMQRMDTPEEQNLLRFVPILGPSVDIDKLATDISRGKF